MAQEESQDDGTMPSLRRSPVSSGSNAMGGNEDQQHRLRDYITCRESKHWLGDEGDGRQKATASRVVVSRTGNCAVTMEMVPWNGTANTTPSNEGKTLRRLGDTSRFPLPREQPILKPLSCLWASRCKYFLHAYLPNCLVFS
ncbi:hypothetical protein CPLU01_04827 [Colletotrichum plurivorum]|uniref:Uncharacterized protein n=1 Tax=Colletotrichum plurivorum TaxID=2175906 RepID=A0A8H6NI80_9PEZI|nr:hypothetical protein CPLU01_04827 [Colletotrichum plurivorum]